MAGLVVICSSSKTNEAEAILQTMAHRGRQASATRQVGGFTVAQNYLRADGAIAADGAGIPIHSPNNPDLVICYDGQMGNWAQLAGEHNIADGPFREERLLLALYQKHGEGMLEYLDDTIFALAITDGKSLFAARDVLGIKTLFYGWKDGALYLASELKGILKVTEEVHEFPNGHFMDGSGRLTRFAEMPKSQPQLSEASIDTMASDIRQIIERSFNNRVDFSLPTGGLLSGGMDSSVINSIASKAYKERFGQDARLKTFALGVGESEDIRCARTVAERIDSEHYELMVDLEQMLEALPQVIYYLESFDPSLVRSSVSNYLISRYAKEQGMEILLSGEGGDEAFCGYKYLGQCPTEELFAKQMECIGFLHNNASLRLDRMNLCHSVRVVAPLISGELLRYAMSIPPQYKQRPDGGQSIEKWIFRKAYEGLLPEAIVWRSKQEFSQGSGSAAVLPAHFERQIADEELAEAQAEFPIIRSKEELHYFRIFTGHFGDQRAVETVGQWLCL